MAKRPDVQYIRLYTDGNAARKVAEAPRTHRKVLPKPRKQKKIVICLNPVAVLGIIAATVLLAMMVSGVLELYSAKQECRNMERYVQELTQENIRLESEYRAGYDLEEIETMALAIGMVPQDQLPCGTISLPQPETAEVPVTIWERIGSFFAGLFA